MDNVESKICRLRQLVNQRYSFYPKSVMKLEEEDINKYDSEEEEELYRQEEIEDKNVKISSEIKKETNKKFVKKEFGLKKKLIKNHNTSSKGNEKDKKNSENPLKQKEDELSDIQSEETVPSSMMEIVPSQFSLVLNDEINSYFNYLENDDNNGDQVKKFKSLFLTFVNEPQDTNKLNDILNHLHCVVANITGVSLINLIICYLKIFRYIINLNIKENRRFNIINTDLFLIIFQDFIKHFKGTHIDQITSEKEQSEYFSFVTGIFDLVDIILEQVIENRVYSDILELSIGFLEHFNTIQNTISAKLYNLCFSKHLSLKNFLFSILNKIYELMKIKSVYILNKTHIKIIFLFCFTILSYKNLANLHILTIKILSCIISKNLDYTEKLLDNVITLFKQFSNSFEEMQVLFPFDEKIYKNYVNYYGIYKSYDNTEICLFSYLLIKIFSVIYEDFENIKLNNLNKKEFNKTFEVFLTKIIDSTDSSNNFIFFVFITDLIKVKYSIEFSITPVVLTNLFIYFSSVIESHSYDLIKRKFFLYLYEIIIDNVLHDFGEMKNFYLCFESKEGCRECFACENHKTKGKIFIECAECLIRTNIFLDSDNLDDKECEFCRIEQIFNNFSSELNIENKMSDIKSGSLEKIFSYQELLSKNTFKFIKYSSIFFLFSSINNDIFSDDIDFSFNIFLQQFYINDNSDSKENNLIKTLHEFYIINRNKITLKNLNICTLFYNYFMFYLQYLNFLFISQIKLIDIILDFNNNWNLRYRSLKMLENFLIFEKDNKIFKHFDIDLFVHLLEDNSLHIKEYTLEMLLLLNQNQKLPDSDLFLVLYRNINDPSILIRMKITKIIIKNYETKYTHIEAIHLKNIILIFLSKLVDSTESLKIKNLITEFLRKNLKNVKKNPLANTTIDLIISILQEKEDINNNVNLFYDNINTFASEITLKQEKLRYCLTDEDLKQFIDYLLEKHFDISNPLLILNSLLMIKLLSSYSQKSLVVFVELFIQLLNNNEFSKDMKLENRIKSYVCEIIANIIDKFDVKANLLVLLEENLLRLILTKPVFLMYSALDTYFKILNKRKIHFDKIQELVSKTVSFLQNHQNLNKNQIKNEELISVIQRSFCLISYTTYLSNEIIIGEIYNFLPLNNSENIVSFIFNLLKDFLWNSNDRRIKFKAFETLGYIWMRNPQFISISNDVIKNIFDFVKLEEEKVIIIKTLNRFFTNVTKIFIQMRNTKEKEDTNTIIVSNFDFGIVHLFFENFMEHIITLILDNNSEMIRSQGLVLLDIIIELGNIHVYKALPYIFSLIFDYSEDVRLRANKLLDNIVNLSKEKFLASLKDSLKTCFDYQRKLFVFPIYLNAFVKTLDRNELSLNKQNLIFNINNSENVFDLLLSKVNKNSKFHINFVEKIYTIWSEINSIEMNDDMEKTFTTLDYISFLANLICDYRFSKFKDVSNIFKKLKEITETNYIVFKTQLKTIKQENKKKIEKKFISFAIINLLQISMMKFLLVKYENFEKICKNKELEEEDEEEEQKEKKDVKVIINKDIKGLKFYEFSSSINIYINHLLLLFKKRNNNLDVIESIVKIKEFYKLPINMIRGYVSNLKKRLATMKINKEEFTKSLFSKIFPDINHELISDEKGFTPEKEKENPCFRTDNKKRENKLRLLKRKYNIQTENKIDKRKKE